MQSILVVGAGREGKGFLGETFSTDGWQVYFLDKDPEVVNALKSGALVISSQGPGLFTEHGHFIVLAGIEGDNGIIVKDPNKNNAINKGYNDRKFTKSEINAAAQNYWIFSY